MRAVNRLETYVQVQHNPKAFELLNKLFIRVVTSCDEHPKFNVV